MKRSLECGAATMLAVCGCVASGRAQVIAPPAQADKAAATAAADVAQAEHEFTVTTGRYRAGIDTAASLVQAQIKLDEARRRQATALGQSHAAIGYAKNVVTNREQLVSLAEAQYRAGVATASDLTQAHIGLTEARIRLELHNLVGYLEQDLATITAQYKAGLVTRAEVDKASGALTAARKRLDDE